MFVFAMGFVCGILFLLILAGIFKEGDKEGDIKPYKGRCYACLNSGDRCVQELGHKDPHMTYVDYQTFYWPNLQMNPNDQT